MRIGNSNSIAITRTRGVVPAGPDAPGRRLSRESSELHHGADLRRCPGRRSPWSRRSSGAGNPRMYHALGFRRRSPHPRADECTYPRPPISNGSVENSAAIKRRTAHPLHLHQHAQHIGGGEHGAASSCTGRGRPCRGFFGIQRRHQQGCLVIGQSARCSSSFIGVHPPARLGN